MDFPSPPNLQTGLHISPRFYPLMFQPDLKNYQHKNNSTLRFAQIQDNHSQHYYLHCPPLSPIHNLMTLLIAGVCLFVAIHLIPSIVPLRTALFSKMGEGAHKGVYSLAALAGLGLMIYGKAYAEFVPVWSPPE